jgi:hypothetical protein
VRGAPGELPEGGRLVMDNGRLVLPSSEQLLANGHAIGKHAGQTEADLAARLAGKPKLKAVSSFATPAELEEALQEALRVNAGQMDTLLSSPRFFNIQAPFDGGLVLERGATSATPGRVATFTFQRDEIGNWYVLTATLAP